MTKRRRSKQLVKALPPMANVGGRVTDMSAVARQMGQQPAMAGLAQPLQRDSFPYAFGPGMPLQPQPIDPTRGDTGRAEPRLWQYPVSWNIHIPGHDQRMVPWQVLRDAADRIALIRDCIRIRKNEVLNLEWDVVITQRAIETAQRADPTAKRIDLERDMRKDLGPQIDRCVQFWQEPDPRNGLDFPTWLSRALEEHLVLDALAIYPRRTLGGDLYGLEILDGTTIRPLLDHTGSRPLPPFPAYQQILYGFPRGEYTADSDAEDAIEGYPADQLIYRVKESRTTSPYGYSAVEQALDDADLWLKRMGWLKAEYTDGVMPAGWLKGDGSTGWTPGQLLAYEQELNDYYSGVTKQRMRWRMLPPGVEPVESRQVDERYKPDYDLHLLKLMTAHFDMTIAELGFTEAKGLGSAGYHEGQENIQERKGTRPTTSWFQSVLTNISRKHLGMPGELEVKFLGLDDEDQAAAVELNIKKYQAGALTLNEMRDDEGAPRYAFAEADMPMIVLQRGILFVEGASEGATPGELIQPASAPPGSGPLLSSPPGGAPEPAGAPAVGESGGEPAGKESAAAKSAEIAAYTRWASKPRGRPFEVHHLTPPEATAAGLDPTRILFKAREADPKAAADRVWSAWQKDEDTARYWAPKISQGFSGINTRVLAQRWLEVRKDADSVGWLSEQQLRLATALHRVLTGVYTDGYVIGQHAATAALSVDLQVDWGGFQPGNTAAAREVAGPGLERLLEQSDTTIRSIAAHRITELGDTLAAGLEHGWSVDTLAGELRGVLDDEAWAYGVAVTETNRAVSFASMLQYQQAGISQQEWLAVPGACELCLNNQEAGAVRVGDTFPSGATAPPGHPYCRCGIVPHLGDLV